MVLNYFGCCLFTANILCLIFLRNWNTCSNGLFIFLLLFFLYWFFIQVFVAISYFFVIFWFAYVCLFLLNFLTLDYLFMTLLEWFLWAFDRFLFLFLAIVTVVYFLLLNRLLLYFRIRLILMFFFLLNFEFIFDILKLNSFWQLCFILYRNMFESSFQL